MKYILEPMVFALDENMSEHDFKRYVNRIVLWDEWMKMYPNDMYVLSDTCELLSHLQMFPIYTVFEALVKKYKINYVNAQTLNKVIQKLVLRSKNIDKRGDKDVDNDISIESLEFDCGTNIDENHRQVLERILKCLYCQCQADEIKSYSFVIFGVGLPMVIDVDVKSITIIESSGELVERIERQRFGIQCKASLVDWFKDGDTPLAILRQTTCKEDISLAVRVSIYQRGNLKRIIDAFQKFDYLIQNSFAADFNKAHYQSNPTVQNSLMESMGHTVLNMQVNKREAFRIDKGGNSKQLNCQGWNAWRRFVTTSIKMQYWQKDSKYKFANVKEHDIFDCQWED